MTTDDDVRTLHPLASPRLRDVLVLVVLALAMVAGATKGWGGVIDDAFIAFRYARHVATGEGFAFNPGGPATEGFTSLSWVLLAAAFIRAGWDVLLGAKIAGLLCGVATLVLTHRLSARLRAREDAWNLLPPALVALNPHVAFACVQGLETALAMLLTVATLLVLMRSATSCMAAWGAPILVLLLIMTRPDAVLLLIPVSVWIGWQAWRTPELRRRVATIAGAMIALLVFYAAWKLTVFGSLVATTADVKVVHQRAPLHRGVFQLVVFVLGQGIAWLALVLLGLAMVSWRGSAAMRVVLLGTLVIQAAWHTMLGGDWMPGFRFLVPVIPLLACAIGMGAAALPWRAGRGIALAVALVACVQHARIETVYVFGRGQVHWLHADADHWTPRGLRRGFSQPATPVLADVALALARHHPRGGEVLMGDYGLPMWLVPDARLLDADGLTDPLMARAGADYELATAFAAARFASNELPESVVVFRLQTENPDDEMAYPIVPAAFLWHEDFDARYREVWRGPKTASGVWTHLYSRRDVAPDRGLYHAWLLRALEDNPRLGDLAIALWWEEGTTLDALTTSRVQVLRPALMRSIANEHLAARLFETAAELGDAMVALDGLERFLALHRARPAWAWQRVAMAFERAGARASAVDILRHGIELDADPTGALWCDLSALLADSPDAAAEAEEAARHCAEWQAQQAAAADADGFSLPPGGAPGPSPALAPLPAAEDPFSTETLSHGP